MQIIYSTVSVTLSTVPGVFLSVFNACLEFMDTAGNCLSKCTHYIRYTHDLSSLMAVMNLYYSNMLQRYKKS